jgi:hypothetical protein
MSELCPLEEKFPRLIKEITACWGTATCYDKLQDLLIDKRGGRQGFPLDVLSDLTLLLTLTPTPKGPYDLWGDELSTEKKY